MESSREISLERSSWNRSIDGLDYVQFINLNKIGANKYELFWEKPIYKAWLVMVDEQILRIDFVLKPDEMYDRAKRYTTVCERSEWYQDFLKCPAWDKKKVEMLNQKLIYSFES